MVEDQPMLNTEVEFLTRANSKLNPLSPKPGIFLVGDNGIEFRSEKSPGYIQIPWDSVLGVRVQMLFNGKYVRGFYIETDENQLLEFIVSDAKETLKHMRNHLKREQFVRNPSNLAQVFKRK